MAREVQEILEKDKTVTEGAVNHDQEKEERKLHIIDRIKDMRRRNEEKESDRTKREKAVEKKLIPHPERDERKAVVAMPLEQILIETYVAAQEQLQYQVEGAASVDGEWLEVYKYVLEHFIEREDFIEEINRYRTRKATYGTGWLLSTVRYTTKLIYNGNSDKIFSKDEATEKYNIFHIGAKSVPNRQALFSYTATNYKEGTECGLMEQIPYEEFQMRYVDNDEIGMFENVDQVKKTSQDSKLFPVTDGRTNNSDYVTLWHYWNKLDASYVIIANENIMIFDGVYACKHGMLPLVPIQHYRNEKGIDGIGIPERMQSIRPYIDQFLQTALDGARLNSGAAILTGGGVQSEGELYLESGGMTEWVFTGDAKGVGTFQPNVNVAQAVEILRLMEDYMIMSTGINVKAPYTDPAGTAFEAGLMKEEQNIRSKSVIELDYYGLDKVLTMMMSNIIQFAPVMLAEKIFDEKGDVTGKEDWYKIRINNKSIKKVDDGGLQIDDAPGYQAAFALDNEAFINAKGLKVKITTPYTTTVMKTIEKAQFTDYLQQKMMISQLKAQGIENADQIDAKVDMLHGFDMEKLALKTKAQRNREKFAETEDMIAEMQQLFTSGGVGNEIPVPSGQSGGLGASEELGGVPGNPAEQTAEVVDG